MADFLRESDDTSGRPKALGADLLGASAFEEKKAPRPSVQVAAASVTPLQAGTTIKGTESKINPLEALGSKKAPEEVRQSLIRHDDELAKMMAGEMPTLPATVVEEPESAGDEGRRASWSAKRGSFTAANSSVKITAVIKSSASVDGVTWYTITVCDEGNYADCKKRYSQFKDLDVRLRKASPVLNQVLPDLPESGRLGFRHKMGDTSFEARREAGLQTYLHALCKNVGPAHLRKFFTDS